MYMEMFSIKDKYNNDINKNFERVAYINNASLEQRLENIIKNNN